jgi:AraC family transcriptional regulator
MSTLAARLAIAALVAGAAAAQTSPVPGWVLSGMNRKTYAIALDHETTHGGSASAIIRCGEKRCGQFGTLMQTIQADPYVGHRLRLSAWVKATKGGHPRIWMRVDGQSGEMLAFDNMDNRSKSGPFDWRYQEVVLDVMPTAALISFGLILDGNGAAWIDDINLDAAPSNAKSTNRLQGPSQPQAPGAAVQRAYNASKPVPANLDFEDQPQH